MGLFGLFGGDEDDDEAKREAERRAAEAEEREAEREREAEQRALTEMREGTVERARETRGAGEMQARGEETSSGEGRRLGRFGGTGERGETPPVDVEEWTTPDQYFDRDKPENEFFDYARRGREQQGKAGGGVSMTIGEPEVTAYIPEDQIQVTPYAGSEVGGAWPTPSDPPRDPNAPPRDVDFAGLQGQLDAMTMGQDPRSLPSVGSLSPSTPPAIDLGDEPIRIQAEQSALDQMAQRSPAESGAALSAPPPPPSAGVAPGSAGALPTGPGGNISTPPPVDTQQALDALQMDRPGGSAPNPGRAEADSDVNSGRAFERAMQVLGALLKIGGAVGGATSIMRGNPIGGLAGAGIAKGGGALTEALGAGRGAEAERDRAVQGQRERFDAGQQRAEERDDLARLQAAMRAQEQDRSFGLAERRVAAQEQNAESLRDLRSTRAAHEGELTEERRAELQARAERLQSQARAAETDTRLTEALNDPTSPESENAQELVIGSRGILGPNFTIDDDRIRQMSAAQLAPFVAQHGSIGRALGRRGGGGVGGGGRRTLPLTDEQLTELGDGDIELGRSRYRALSASARNELIMGGERLDPNEILPGVRSTVALSDTEIRQTRDTIGTVGKYIEQLEGIRRVADRYGISAANRFSPQARAAAQPYLDALQGMVAQIKGTGIINPSEAPAIEAALPNPSAIEQATFGSFMTRWNAWTDLTESGLRAHMRSRGVPDDGIRRTLQIMRSGVPGGGSAPSSDGGSSSGERRVRRVTNPSGETRELPLSDEEAERYGAREGWSVE